MKSSIVILAFCLTFVIAAPAQEGGVIFCGSKAAPSFTVPVRMEPGRGLVVENAVCGQRIAVLGIEQGFAKIQSWYSMGYVSLEFIQLAAPAPMPAVSQDRAVIECEGSSNVPVYSDIRATLVMANLTCGQPVSFLEMERGYVKIQIAERTGYVAASAVKLERRNAQPAIPSPSAPPVYSPAPQQAESQPQAATKPSPRSQSAQGQDSRISGEPIISSIGESKRVSPAQPATKLVLEDGTPLKIRISRNISSADAKIGEQVDFEVLEEVKVGDLVVIPKGGIAWGTVTEAEAKKRMGRGGKLNMTIDNVRLLNGEKAALRGVREMKGGGRTGAMTAGIVVTGLIVWPAAPFFLFMHGKDISIPRGTEITAYINGNINLDRSKFDMVAATVR